MTQMTKASQIVPGDILDLEGDPYADDPNDEMQFPNQYQYAVVEAVEQETDYCVVIYTVENGNFACPPSHRLKKEN